MAFSAEFRVKDFELRRSRRFALWDLAPGHRDHHCGLGHSFWGSPDGPARSGKHEAFRPKGQSQGS